MEQLFVLRQLEKFAYSHRSGPLTRTSPRPTQHPDPSNTEGSATGKPTSKAAPPADLASFWQPRFHDFNVHSAKKRRKKLDYMHANPVKRKRVSDPCAWFWSSASFYAKGIAGLVPIDPVP